MSKNPSRVRIRSRRYRRYRRSPVQRAVSAAATLIYQQLDGARSIAHLRRLVKAVQQDEKLWGGFKALELASKTLGDIDL